MAFSINLNAQHANGMTHFDLAMLIGKLVKLHIPNLDDGTLCRKIEPPY